MRRSLVFAAVLLLSSCPDSGTNELPPEPWVPGMAYRSPEGGPRDLLDLRGLIHAHSVYSHDACDGEPRDETTGAIDEACFQDFRRGMCQARHDFIMLTDHRGTFADTEFPDTLLYRPDVGDVLVERGGPVANRAACEGDETTLILAGTESGTMPVGLEGHVSADPSERSSRYGSTEPADIQAFKDQGAVVLLQHTEGWSVTELVEMPIDGFEMYNVHANLFLRIGEALQLIQQLQDAPEELPHSDLTLLPLMSEDPNYVETWARVLFRGVKRVTTMGSDCHRNTFRDILPDGERIDSYRRMMMWYSNHLLVRPEADGTWDDRHLKDALRAGRLYGVFEVLGYAEGFDFHAAVGGATHEMGEEVSIAAGTELRVARPDVVRLDPEVTPPELTVRLLRATDEGWVEVAAGSGDLAFTPTVAGAYRAEVRMHPHHLVQHLSSYDYLAEEVSFVWIYSNPIYVVD